MSEQFSQLQGKTLKSIIGATKDSREILFETTDGEEYQMDHRQDCCEYVRLEDIVGDVNDLIGSPILRAEERSNQDANVGESATWTFYELATIKGSVTLRWLGESNGYYSEEVSFKRID